MFLWGVFEMSMFSGYGNVLEGNLGFDPGRNENREMAVGRQCVFSKWRGVQPTAGDQRTQLG